MLSPSPYPLHKLSGITSQACAPCTPIQGFTLDKDSIYAMVLQEVKEIMSWLPQYRLECITVARAAELLKCYPDTVRTYIRQNKLRATKIGNDYRIKLTALEDFLNRNEKKSALVKSFSTSKKLAQ